MRPKSIYSAVRNTLLIPGICLLIFSSPCGAEEFISDEAGIKFAAPSGFVCKGGAEKTVISEGETGIILGSCSFYENIQKERIVFLGLRVIEYADYSLSGMPLDQYVTMSLAQDQKLLGTIKPVTSKGWEGVAYTIEEPAPDPSYGRVYSFIGLLWLDNSRILEFYATTLPKEDFSNDVPTFETAFASLEFIK